MIEFFTVAFIAFLASCLTFFSGFGLGTILLPAFALFFPVEIAVALTAIVHFLNNIFKFFLVGKHAKKQIILRFGIPAVFMSFLGAFLLVHMAKLPVLLSYNAWGAEREITILNLSIAVLIALFAFLEILPAFEKLALPQKYLLVGGVLSGFFGGLSGHQGAFRSAFLMKSGLAKESFIATGVAIALLIDISRITVYASSFSLEILEQNVLLLLLAVLSAFLGAYLGNKFLKKMSLKSMHWIVSFMLFVFALALGLGFL